MGAIVPWSSGSMEKKLDPFDKYRKKWAHAAFDKPEVSKPASVTDTANTAGDSAVSTSSEKWNRRNRVRKSSIFTLDRDLNASINIRQDGQSCQATTSDMLELVA